MEIRYVLKTRFLRSPLVVVQVLEHGMTDPDSQTFECRPFTRWRNARADDLFDQLRQLRMQQP